MPFPWRSSAKVFTRILRRQGVNPDAVTDVDAAWRAFEEFLRVEIDGIETEPGTDPDGFIIQWGRYSWNEGKLSLSFTRQLAVPDGDDRDDPDRQVEYWQIELQMFFDDQPDLAGLESLSFQDTGFSFEAIGPKRAARLAAARTEMERHAQLSAVLRATPTSSRLSFTCVH